MPVLLAIAGARGRAAFEESGKTGDFAIQKAQLAIDLLNLELQSITGRGGFGNNALHGGAHKIRDAARAVRGVETFQGFKFGLGESQAHGAALPYYYWHGYVPVG